MSKQPVKNSFGSRSTAEEVTRGLELRGKTIVITGANSGIGFESMRVLAMRGAHVIGMARTMEKAKAACAGVKGTTTPVACELSDFDSVKAAAKTVAAMKIPIDVLICNAGIMALPVPERKSGIELQFYVNHLGHFLLANLLLEQVKKARAGRIVVVSSRAHKFAPKAEGIMFDNLSGEKWYSPWKFYGMSKLANALFAMELSRRLDGTGVTVNALHPGDIPTTNLVRHMGIPPFLVKFATLFYGKNTPQGAATQCYLAAHPDLEGVSGYYFSDCNAVKPGAHVEDASLAKKLWLLSEELTGAYLK